MTKKAKNTAAIMAAIALSTMPAMASQPHDEPWEWGKSISPSAEMVDKYKNAKPARLMMALRCDEFPGPQSSVHDVELDQAGYVIAAHEDATETTPTPFTSQTLAEIHPEPGPENRIDGYNGDKPFAERLY
ncbi:MAG: hypothetical protein KBB83_01315 [Alphaproteobacteria bacterium]|nr:hypothetical protein [Alphaproteobacteria bacterium]